MLSQGKTEGGVSFGQYRRITGAVRSTESGLEVRYRCQ